MRNLDFRPVKKDLLRNNCPDDLLGTISIQCSLLK